MKMRRWRDEVLGTEEMGVYMGWRLGRSGGEM